MHSSSLARQKTGKGPVYVVDQVDQKTGAMDEHKMIIGAASEQGARHLPAQNCEGLERSR